MILIEFYLDSKIIRVYGYGWGSSGKFEESRENLRATLLKISFEVTDNCTISALKLSYLKQ